MTEAAGVEGTPEAPTELKVPAPVAESPDVQSAPAVGKWPWQISAAIAAVALIAVFVVLTYGWIYIVQHNEAEEGADWEQLLGIIDRVQNIAIFVLGALLGVSVTGAAAKSAATTADKNKLEAERQHDAAKQNMQVAENNMKVAELAVRDTRAAASELASQIEQARAGSLQAVLEQIGGGAPVLDLRRADPADAVSELDLNRGRYKVIPESSLDGVPDAPDTSKAERLVSELRQRWE